MDVVTARVALDVLGIVEELDGEAERVLDAHGLADAAGGARRAAFDPASEVREVPGGDLDLGLRAHPVGEGGERGDGAFAQDERVVQVLLEGPQVDGGVVLVGDDEAEHVDVEGAADREVAHDELGVRGADDVERRGGHADAPNLGVWTGDRLMCTACCSV